MRQMHIKERSHGPKGGEVVRGCEVCEMVRGGRRRRMETWRKRVQEIGGVEVEREKEKGEGKDKEGGKERWERQSCERRGGEVRGGRVTGL